jgi:hypothetical protein
MTVMNASKFKEQCLSLIDRLVAKVIPIESSCAHLIGALKGKLRIKGDVFSTDLAWDAARESGKSAK